MWPLFVFKCHLEENNEIGDNTSEYDAAPPVGPQFLKLNILVNQHAIE
jgi:hypothetical protein